MSQTLEKSNILKKKYKKGFGNQLRVDKKQNHCVNNNK